MAWIHIDVQPQAFTQNELRVKDMLDHGKNMFQIAAKMYMGIDYVRDMIYSIRKKEAIILAKLSNQEKGEIYRSYKNGTPQTELAKKYGVTKSAICQIIQNLKKAEREVYGESVADKPMPNTGINEDFEQAVDAMIEEREAADAEQKSAIAEPEKLPPVVRRAIDDQISEYEFQISERDSRIEELKDEIAEFRKDIAALKAWKEAHDD